METSIRELEGTWEEILSHAAELTGRRVRVTILSPPKDPISSERRLMLRVADDLQSSPWTPEEVAVLDGFEAFQRQNPFRVSQLKDKP